MITNLLSCDTVVETTSIISGCNETQNFNQKKKKLLTENAKKPNNFRLLSKIQSKSLFLCFHIPQNSSQQRNAEQQKSKNPSSTTRTGSKTLGNRKCTTIRTFALLVLGELPLERAIDHVGEAILAGSRARGVRLACDGIDLLRLGGVGEERESGEAVEEDGDEGEDEERRENRRRSNPHCRGKVLRGREREFGRFGGAE